MRLVFDLFAGHEVNYEIAQTYCERCAAEYQRNCDRVGRELCAHTERHDAYDAERKADEGEDATTEQAKVENFASGFLRFLKGLGQFVGIDTAVGFDCLNEHFRALVIIINRCCEYDCYDSYGEYHADEDGNSLASFKIC